MPSKVLNKEQLDAILGEVEQLDETQLAELAAAAAKRQETQKKYRGDSADLSPEEREKRKAQQRMRGAIRRARDAAILEKSYELGLLERPKKRGDIAAMGTGNAKGHHHAQA